MTPGTFEWALAKMKVGESVARDGWEEQGGSLFMDSGVIKMGLRDFKPWMWRPSPDQEEILATDWRVVEREG